MKSGFHFLTGALLFAAGLLVGTGWKHIIPATSAPIPDAAAGKTALTMASYTSLENAIRQAPELVLEDLARDPYLTLTDTELELLAATLDLRKESHRRLLNRVTPQDRREKLWIAVLRDSIGKMPLEEVAKLSREGKSKSDAYWGPILNAIHDSPDRKEILESGWGKNYLLRYLDMVPRRIPHLEDALALVPPGEADPSMRERLIEGWIEANPSVENIREIFKLKDLPMRLDSVRANAVFSVWRNKPEHFPALLAEVDTLPPPQRNRMMGSLISVRPPETAGEMVDMLSHLTSAGYQRELTDRWLEKKGGDFRELIIRQLEARKDDPTMEKLREHLRQSSPATGK